MQTSQIALKVSEIKSKAKELNPLGLFTMGSVFKYLFPDFYLYLWARFTEALAQVKGYTRFAIGIPRGHAKTVFIKLLCVYIVLFTKRNFILVVASNDTNATNIVADIVDMLSSTIIVRVFGNWAEEIEIDQAGQKKFRFGGRNIVLKAVGVTSGFRGINLKLLRPDVMIFDDMQTSENASSIVKARELQNIFYSKILYARSPEVCTFIYIGNMYRDILLEDEGENKVYTCILRNLQNDPEWTTIITGGILADGTALWEELVSVEQMLADFRMNKRQMMPEIFYSEILNNPKGGALKYIDFSKIPSYPVDHEVELPIGRFVIVDPSLMKKKSDEFILGLFELYTNARLVYKKIKKLKCSLTEIAENVVQFALEEQAVLIAYESYGSQEISLAYIDKHIRDYNILGLVAVPLTRGHMAKNSAILYMFKQLMSGELHMNGAVRPKIVDQIIQFDPMRTDNKDDILDVGAYAGQVILHHLDDCLLPLDGSLYEQDNSVGLVDLGR
jgi:anti-sigma regulatory factor (Ser/Thr protein kinase)